MVYETSYESGRKPFLPDVGRGNWGSPSDYIYACVGLAFKIDIFSLNWLYFGEGGLATVIPYLIIMIPYIVPLLVIHAFMGQFSSSGFISAFRVSPFFKGMGYVSLAVNLWILIYYSLLGAIPILFFFNSLRPTLPWSCDTPQYWAKNINETDRRTICNTTLMEPTETEHNSSDISHYVFFQVPSTLYFKSLFGDSNKFDYMSEEHAVSIQLIFCNFVIWGIVGGILYKFFHPEQLGKVLRYLVWAILTLLAICITRFLFLPGAMEAVKLFFIPKHHSFAFYIPNMSLFAVIAFGPGWGTIVAMASLNKFKTNILRHSWYIALGQMFIVLALAFTTTLLEEHFADIFSEQDMVKNVEPEVETFLILLLSSASALAKLELANLWSLLYFGMLTCASLFILIVQTYALLVSIFDEFVILRARKLEVTMGLIGGLSLVSIYFCSTYGVLYFPLLSVDSFFTQTALNLMLILVCLWVYGRERFQRDIEFMLGQPFATWKVYTLRFITPIFLLFTMLMMALLAVYDHAFSTTAMIVFAMIFTLIPWLFVPGYGIFCMFMTTGPAKTRFQRCCRPTDWYPVDPEDRQRYEESVGNTDATHQLNDINDEVL